MALSVIGVGRPRTGTMSLKFALEQLGFGPCCHMTEVLANRAIWPAWKDAANGAPDWETLFRGYRATVDAPGCFFWRQLAEYYPEAKLILSTRDSIAWLNSMQATVLSLRMQQGLNDPEYQDTLGFAVRSRIAASREEFQKFKSDKEALIREFERHNSEVVASIPRDRLLVFEVSQGWEPLCAFLKRPVPDTPFPRENRSEAFFDNEANLPLDERPSRS